MVMGNECENEAEANSLLAEQVSVLFYYQVMHPYNLSSVFALFAGVCIHGQGSLHTVTDNAHSPLLQ